MMAGDAQVTIDILLQEIGLSTTAVENNITMLKEKGFAERIDQD